MLDLDSLLGAAAEQGVSDILLAVEVPPVHRIGGELVRYDDAPLSVADCEGALRHLATPAQLEHLEHWGEVDFSYSLRGVGRFRVAAFRQRGSISLAIRPISSTIPDVAALNAPDGVGALALRESGLVLVAGRTGSGKSTTVAAMVDCINRERAAHVITLEDPVEYLHRHRRSIINQREIGVDSMDFPRALRAALRQNPDVIVVGDLHDADTAQTALAAAGTGQLVIAVVRQPDSASALEYIVGLFRSEQQAQISWQLASVLEGAVAQVLLARTGGGRIAVFEVLIGTPAVRTLVRDGKRAQVTALLRAGARHGMRSLDQSWRELVERGLVEDTDIPPFSTVNVGVGG